MGDSGTMSKRLRYVPGGEGEMQAERPTLFRPADRQGPARVCLIAEIGVNHDGRLDRALNLVHAAAHAGADAVKLQLFDPRHLLSNQARFAAYQQQKITAVDNHTNQDEEADGVFAMLDKLTLSMDEMHTVKQLAKRLGLAFIVTAFSLDDVAVLEALDVDAVKIASPDAVNRPLLERVAALGKPLIVSTGTCELEELTFVADLLRRHAAGGCLLQCVSSYPTPAHDAALGGMRAMAERFGLPVGYSDHTNDVTIGALAVAAGACVLEKHITYDRRAAGPDHAASFEPADFAMYAMLAGQATLMLGPVAKTVQPVEADVRHVSRQSVCVKRDLPAGHVLDESDLTVKRPGTGIPAARLKELVGRTLQKAVCANDLLAEGDLAQPSEVAKCSA